MRRLLGRFAAVAMLATALTFSTAAPAGAHSNTCIGQGWVQTDGPLTYVGFGPPRVTHFTMVFPNTGICTSPGWEVLNGTVSGNCGLATGAGVTGSGHTFTFRWSGNNITFLGGVAGELDIQPDSTTGESCVSGADRFLVTGGIHMSHTAQ